MGSHAMASATTSTLRGGILLRSVLRVSDGQVICKPAAVVNEILRLSGADNVYELAEHIWNGDISAFPPQASGTWADPLFAPASSTMYIVRTERPASTVPITEKDVLFKHGMRRIFSSPRVGLDLSDLTIPHPSAPSSSSSSAFGASSLPSDLLAHPRFQYVARPYRFFLAPYLLVANGGERAPTFLGVHDFLVGGNPGAQHATLSPELLEDITRLTGMWGMTVRPFHKALSTARADPVHAGSHEGGVGVVGVGDGETRKGTRGRATANKADALEWIGKDGLSDVQWLRMIGTLRRLRAHARRRQDADFTADS
ncbi:hypothetical protein C8Q80DRAFT_305031 [Daedaleopsis nitida]|nr:hypothetical protein C8Q80DRAFT_305031 [Daedaleopsis nitida]